MKLIRMIYVCPLVLLSFIIITLDVVHGRITLAQQQPLAPTVRPNGSAPGLFLNEQDTPPSNPTKRCLAVVRTAVDPRNNVFYGSNASLTNHKPKTEQYQWSASRIKLAQQNESIEAGWMVFPEYFNDSDAHLYVKYTIDGEECLNTECPGFVQVSQRLHLGMKPDPYSTPGSPVLWKLSILKNQDDDNWYLRMAASNWVEDYEVVGYWPKTLFVDLREVAGLVEWGGETHNPSSHHLHSTPPTMGSGFKVDHEKIEVPRTDSAYFEQITVAVLDEELAYVKPTGFDKYANCEELYNVEAEGEHDHTDRMHYGGYYDY